MMEQKYSQSWGVYTEFSSGSYGPQGGLSSVPPDVSAHRAAARRRLLLMGWQEARVTMLAVLRYDQAPGSQPAPGTAQQYASQPHAAQHSIAEHCTARRERQ